MIGARIRRRRQQLGLSLSETARRAGISRQALLAIEQGRMPRADTAVRLAQVLGTTAEDLLAPDRDPVFVGSRTRWARWALVRQLTLFGVEGLQADVQVTGQGLTPLPQARPPERVVVVAGCDPALPIIADWMARLHPGWWCDVWPCPSQEALTLLRTGCVHVAGIHLHHPSGYNRPWATDIPGAMGIHAVTWRSGLVGRVREDLEAWEAHWTSGRMILRQPGSEARALAERRALGAGLARPEATAPEAHSHLQAARWVANGRAPVAIATEAAAAAYGLEFAPWAEEPFDWVTDAEPTPATDRLLATLTHPLVRASLAELPGYMLQGIGQRLWTNPPGSP
jgi:transcriptional regulator with XRE-family HTH domain/molybdate-binding protein